MIKQNIELYRGDTASYTVEVLGDDGTPVDLSNAVVAMRVQPLTGAYIEPELHVGGHKIDILFPSHLTAGLTWSIATYDLQVTRGDIVTTIMRGNVQLTQDITP